MSSRRVLKSFGGVSTYKVEALYLNTHAIQACAMSMKGLTYEDVALFLNILHLPNNRLQNE